MLNSRRSKVRTVEQCSCIQVGAELPLRIREQASVKLLLLGTEVIPPDDDCPWWQPEVICPLNLGTTKHDPIEQDAKLLECNLAWAKHTVLLDRSQNLIIPEAGMLHWAVVTICITVRSVSIVCWTNEYIREGGLPSQVLLSLNFQCNDLQSHRLPGR